MKKVLLNKVQQKDKVFYSLVEDPRIIVKLLPKVEAGQVQDTQRPWIKKKVKEIATFVAGKVTTSDNYKATGLIPNAPIINIKDKLKIEIDPNTGSECLMLPVTKEEFQEYEDTIEAIDGQHRIRAFDDECRDPLFYDDIKYEMIFSLFDRLSKKDKQEIFMITNEKQDKVSSNLLRLLRKSLNLLGEGEVIFDLVCKLNEEDFSALKGRIMIGSDKISKGYQEGQISKIIKNSQTFEKLNKMTSGDIDKMVKVISNYLQAWEKIYDINYRDPGKETITKISGLRYIFYLFTEVLEAMSIENKTATTENFKSILELLPNAIEIENVFEDNSTSLAFRGEGATVKLAKNHANKLYDFIQKKNEKFNPTEGV